jgi:hypothetical protein
MAEDGTVAPDPSSHGAEFLDAYLPKNLFGRYAFYVILGTAVLITSISAALTPISLVRAETGPLDSEPLRWDVTQGRM